MVRCGSQCGTDYSRKLEPDEPARRLGRLPDLGQLQLPRSRSAHVGLLGRRGWPAPHRAADVGCAGTVPGTGPDAGAVKRPAARKAAFGEMLEIWEDEVPGMLLYRPVEIYGVRDDIQWQNYGMYWMDFRDYNISFDTK